MDLSKMFSTTQEQGRWRRTAIGAPGSRLLFPGLWNANPFHFHRSVFVRRFHPRKKFLLVPQSTISDQILRSTTASLKMIQTEGC